MREHLPTSYKHILEPLTIGEVEIKHRIMVTGHTQLYGNNGTLSQRHIDYYRERAKGGVALMVLEQQAAHPSGKNYSSGCEAWSKKSVPWYERLAEVVHEHGCKQFVQLFCCGAQGNGTQYFDDWRPLWAASRIPSAISGEMPVAMEKKDINDLVDHFARSALNVRESGLDGIEIHAAHSQLLGEFLSPAFNKRKDEYGGSIENRCRIILEISSAIRKAVGRDFPLGLRLSFDEYLGDAGITGDQSEKQIRIFSESKLFDFYDISGGGYHNLHIAVAPMGTVTEGFLASSAARVKKIVRENEKVFVVGKFLDLGHAEKVLADGHADVVAMTRAHMADPFLVSKSLNGKQSEITKCIGANVCVKRLIEDREVTCFQNPAMGREEKFGSGTISKVEAKNRKAISVIGGGPAGLRFSGTAAEAGHKVRLFETEEKLGGHLNVLKLLPTRTAWQTGIDNLVSRIEKNKVEIFTEWVPNINLLSDDLIVIATGSYWSTRGYSPYRPERDGIPKQGNTNVLDISSAILTVDRNPEALGKKIVIVDETGDYLPLGLAEILSKHGVNVNLISPKPFIGAETQRTLDMPHVMPRLKKAGVNFIALNFIEKIENDIVHIYDIWGGDSRQIENVDSVVLAISRLPNEKFYIEQSPEFSSMKRIGDVVAPRKLEAIIFEAEKTAREI